MSNQASLETTSYADKMRNLTNRNIKDIQSCSTSFMRHYVWGQSILALV